VPRPQEEVIQLREATTTTEPADATVVCVVEPSALEAAVAWETIAALVKEAKDRAILAKREAWERVSRMEVETSRGEDRSVGLYS
jgi:hypothetical protein